jgi:hypothetical protein
VDLDLLTKECHWFFLSQQTANSNFQTNKRAGKLWAAQGGSVGPAQVVIQVEGGKIKEKKGERGPGRARPLHGRRGQVAHACMHARASPSRRTQTHARRTEKEGRAARAHLRERAAVVGVVGAGGGGSRRSGRASRGGSGRPSLTPAAPPGDALLAPTPGPATLTSNSGEPGRRIAGG